MQTEGIPCYEETTCIREKYPGYRYAVHFIEHEDIVQRKIGYSLLATFFQQLPGEMQEYVKKMWKKDQEKGKMPEKFVKCCETIFIEEGRRREEKKSSC
ncbi:MAG: hypothetical protein ACTSX6_02310 [Candidatus Heimdallarchaeaceae archaeon]